MPDSPCRCRIDRFCERSRPLRQSQVEASKVALGPAVCSYEKRRGRMKQQGGDHINHTASGPPRWDRAPLASLVVLSSQHSAPSRLPERVVGGDVEHGLRSLSVGEAL
jgi:hypothetical protein